MMHYLISKDCPLQIIHQINLNHMNWNPHHLFQHKIMLAELKLKKLDSCYTYQISHYHLPLIGPLYKFPLSMSTTQKAFFPWFFQLCFPHVHHYYYNHEFIRLIYTNMHFTSLIIMTPDLTNLLSMKKRQNGKNGRMR